MVKKIKFNSEKDNKASAEKAKNQSKKSDKYQDFLSKYISATVVVAFGVLLVLVIGFFKFRESRLARLEKEGQEAIWRAQKYFEDKKWNDALHGDDLTPGLLAISKKWKNTKVGRQAYMYIALIYMNQNRYEDAIDYLNKVQFRDKVLQSVVWCMKGDAYSEMKDYKNALKWYEKAATAAPNDQTTPLYLKKMAGVWEILGNKQQAKKCYEQITKEFPEGPDYDDAQKYLGFLNGSTK